MGTRFLAETLMATSPLFIGAQIRRGRRLPYTFDHTRFGIDFSPRT